METGFVARARELNSMNKFGTHLKQNWVNRTFAGSKTSVVNYQVVLVIAKAGLWHINIVHRKE